jgi:hypothetical protein
VSRVSLRDGTDETVELANETKREPGGAEGTPGLHPRIADRSNLLLKRSGRVNRILGPEEDLGGPLARSLQQARRQRELMPVRCPDCGKRFSELSESVL